MERKIEFQKSQTLSHATSKENEDGTVTFKIVYTDTKVKEFLLSPDIAGAFAALLTMTSEATQRATLQYNFKLYDSDASKEELPEMESLILDQLRDQLSIEKTPTTEELKSQALADRYLEANRTMDKLLKKTGVVAIDINFNDTVEEVLWTETSELDKLESNIETLTTLWELVYTLPGGTQIATINVKNSITLTNVICEFMYS